jgi:hypothetical protein
MAGLRVVLDTNVLVSGLAYPASIPGLIVSCWRQGGAEQDANLRDPADQQVLATLPHRDARDILGTAWLRIARY